MRVNEINSNELNKFPYSLSIWEDQNDLVDSIVNILEGILRIRISESAAKPIGLATGRTMEPIYLSLVERLKSWEDLELNALRKSWHSFNLDEYVGLSRNDANSFNNQMLHFLGKPLSLDPKVIRVPNGMAEDPWVEACEYSNAINKLGGCSIQLLGLGINGHIGFNEPPCYADSICRVVKLSKSTREQNAFLFRGNNRDVPQEAITLGISEILKAEKIYLIVTGSSKHKALNELLYLPSSKYLPASWLRLHKQVNILADRKAIEGN